MESIQAAQNDAELGPVLDDVNAAQEHGELDKGSLETLARLMWERSRQLYRQEHPPVVRATVPVPVPDSEPTAIAWADELSPDDTCWSCGQNRWWRKASGQRVCGACHPEPRQKQVKS